MVYGTANSLCMGSKSLSALMKRVIGVEPSFSVSENYILKITSSVLNLTFGIAAYLSS
ncbi:MAG: hypothetical protein JWM11_264 [Planctomycetaceae bacterium]|nr:hypothetical protein [Planctomycetaceae bacterium]